MIEGGSVDSSALSALAAAVGSGLIDAMTTDAWQTVRSRVARVIARGSKQSEEDIAKQLDASQARIQASRMTAGRLPVKQSERDVWTRRLDAVLANNSGLAPEFEFLLKLIRETSAKSGTAVTQYTAAGRDAYTAGADQHISIRSQDHDER